MDWIQNIGRFTLERFSAVGRATFLLIGAIFGGKPNLIKAFPLFVKQVYVVGVLSLVIIVVSGLFIGMV